MKLSRAIEILEGLYKKYGDCETLLFDFNNLEYYPIKYIQYVNENDFKENLKEDIKYNENFKKELNNIIIL